MRLFLSEYMFGLIGHWPVIRESVNGGDNQRQKRKRRNFRSPTIAPHAAFRPSFVLAARPRPRFRVVPACHFANSAKKSPPAAAWLVFLLRRSALARQPGTLALNLSVLGTDERLPTGAPLCAREQSLDPDHRACGPRHHGGPAQMKSKTPPMGRRHGIAAVRFDDTPGQAATYDRVRDLPRVLPLMNDELDVASLAGHARLLERLRDALRKERTRGRQGHWCYDVGRHAALLRAYRCEAALLHARSGRPLGAKETKTATRPETKSACRHHYGQGYQAAVAAQSTATSRGACRGPSCAPDPSGRRHSWAPPSGSRGAGPTSRDIAPETGCSACAGAASAT